MNKPTDASQGSIPGQATKITSITTNPVANAVSIQPNTQKTVIVTSSVYRDKSMSPISSSTTSSPSPPPLAPLFECSSRVGHNVTNGKKHPLQVQKLEDTTLNNVIKVPSGTSSHLSGGQLSNLKQSNTSHLKSNESAAYLKTSPKALSNSSSSSSFSIKESTSSTSSTVASSTVYSKNNAGGSGEALNV